jgi:tetratricopeptide (TPR) repeat protein
MPSLARIFGQTVSYGSLEDVFDLQDKVASSVAGVIEPTLQAAETIRLARRPTGDPTAYDLYLRAYEMVLSSGALLADALHLMEQAIERDPDYGPALGWAAVCYNRMVYDGRSKNPDLDLQKAKDLARRALQVSGDDPGVIGNAAVVLAALGEDLATMTALMNHALVLNPNFARGWYLSAGLRLAAGELERAIEHAQIAMRLAPRGRIGAVHTVLGFAYFVSGRFAEATSTLLLAIEQAPNFPSPYRYLAACYAHMGRLDEAREIIRRLRVITAAVMPPIVYLRKSEHRELLLSGLRLAMGEG